MKKYAVAVLVFLFSVFSLSITEAREWRRSDNPQTLRQAQPTSSPVPTHIIITDPEGDDLNFDNQQRVDVISIEAGTNGVDMTVRINFSNTTVMSAVVGYVDLDTDQDRTTGVEASGNIFVPGTNQDLGVDYQLDFFSLPQTGNVQVRDPITWDILGTFPATVEGQSITTTIPLSVVGNDDGFVYVGAALGNIDMATDAAPNEGHGFLLGPGRVTISPSSSLFVGTQTVDILFFVTLYNQPVTSVEITLDGTNITEAVFKTAKNGRTPDLGNITVRIPNVNAQEHLGFGNNGRHVLSIIINTPAGVFSDEAVYTVIPNNEL